MLYYLTLTLVIKEPLLRPLRMMRLSTRLGFLVVGKFLLVVSLLMYGIKASMYFLISKFHLLGKYSEVSTGVLRNLGQLPILQSVMGNNL